MEETNNDLFALRGLTAAQVRDVLGEPDLSKSWYDIYRRDGTVLFVAYSATADFGDRVENTVGCSAFFDSDRKCILSDNVVPLSPEETEKLVVGLDMEDPAFRPTAIVSIFGSMVLYYNFLTYDCRLIRASVVGASVEDVQQLDIFSA